MRPSPEVRTHLPIIRGCHGAQIHWWCQSNIFFLFAFSMTRSVQWSGNRGGLSAWWSVLYYWLRKIRKCRWRHFKVFILNCFCVYCFICVKKLVCSKFLIFFTIFLIYQRELLQMVINNEIWMLKTNSNGIVPVSAQVISSLVSGFRVNLYLCRVRQLQTYFWSFRLS